MTRCWPSVDISKSGETCWFSIQHTRRRWSTGVHPLWEHCLHFLSWKEREPVGTRTSCFVVFFVLRKVSTATPWPFTQVFIHIVTSRALDSTRRACRLQCGWEIVCAKFHFGTALAPLRVTRLSPIYTSKLKLWAIQEYFCELISKTCEYVACRNSFKTFILVSCCTGYVYPSAFNAAILLHFLRDSFFSFLRCSPFLPSLSRHPAVPTMRNDTITTSTLFPEPILSPVTSNLLHRLVIVSHEFAYLALLLTDCRQDLR